MFYEQQVKSKKGKNAKSINAILCYGQFYIGFTVQFNNI